MRRDTIYSCNKILDDIFILNRFKMSKTYDNSTGNLVVLLFSVYVRSIFGQLKHSPF